MNESKILIIMPFYFGYEKTISSVLKKKNYNVFLIDENLDERSLFSHFLYVYTTKIKTAVANKYYLKKLKNIPDTVDAVLVINGRTLTPRVIKYLKQKYRTAKFIMYQWDSVEKVPHAVNIASICDICYTFDPVDAEKYGWKYRPLFFDNKHCTSEIKKYDLSFLCSLHSQRVQVLNEIEKLGKEYKKRIFTYMYTEKWSFFRQKYIKRNPSFQIDNKRVRHKKLSLEQTNKIYAQSRCIVDYKFPEQNGLTMRTIESIGHRCKLITNNKNVYNEDFYNPNNIYVYDLNNFNIPKQFFESEYEDIAPELVYKYTIEGWTEDILCF